MSFVRHVIGASLLGLVFLVGAPPHEGHHSVLWVQTAAEYRALTHQAWSAARLAVHEALEDPTWTAALEQAAREDWQTFPPALIVDIDETVLDNSPYQARLALDGAVYDSKSWNAWVEEAAAPAIPGALATLVDAAGSGVTVFYVTNRNHEVEEATLRNLARLGFPLSSSRDTVLTQDEKPEWGSDKTSRREFVARTHRILLLVGDDLGDFSPARRSSVADRARAVDELRDFWGRRWIVLPNPMYGSWQRAIVDFADLDPEVRIRRERDALDPRRAR